MRIFKKIFWWFRDLRFRQKLLLSYIILLIIPIVLISLRFFGISSKNITEQASKNIYGIIKKSNEVVGTRLSKIQENSLSIISDPDLFEIVNNTVENTNFLAADRKTTEVLNKYFGHSSDIYSVQLASSKYIFGENTSYMSCKSMIKSDLYQEAVQNDGKLRWIPTYDYTKMFGHTDLKDITISNRYIFSAVRLVNNAYYDTEKGVYRRLDKDVERPILIMNFTLDIFDNIFDQSILIEGANLYIIADDGTIVWDSNGMDKAGTDINWIDTVKRKSGTNIVNGGKEDILLCYDTSIITGWTTVAVIPQRLLMKDIMVQMKTSMMYIVIIFLVLSILLAVFISRMISNPINELLKTVNKMGQGDFRVRIPIKSRDEMGYFVKKFNELNEKISMLIEENYKTKIREKEMEIMALNMQMNPHFLYNTLNIINWMALEEGSEDISKIIMSVSSMLEYTFKNKKETVLLRDDLDWLECYIEIMMFRFEDKFSVEMNIDQELFEFYVPKLFLQPFVENSIIHGFEFIENGGVIKITGVQEGNIMHFTIQDNGRGMDERRVQEIMNLDYSSIGVSNVDMRIKLLYGKEYGVEIKSHINNGTIVSIKIPKVKGMTK